jgi:hypothetical protein
MNTKMIDNIEIINNKYSILKEQINKLFTKVQDSNRENNRERVNNIDRKIKDTNKLKINPRDENYNNINNINNNNNNTNKEFIIFENKIKSLLIKDQNTMQIFKDNLISKIEERMFELIKSVKFNNENIRNYLIQIKENFDVEIFLLLIILYYLI